MVVVAAPATVDDDNDDEVESVLVGFLQFSKSFLVLSIESVLLSRSIYVGDSIRGNFSGPSSELFWE